MFLLLSAMYLWDPYRTGFTIALVIQSVNPSLWDLLSPSLSAQLIDSMPLLLLE